MASLNLNGNYAEQMLSLYLWGQTTAPSPNDIADEKFIRPASAINILLKSKFLHIKSTYY